MTDQLVSMDDQLMRRMTSGDAHCIEILQDRVQCAYNASKWVFVRDITLVYGGDMICRSFNSSSHNVGQFNNNMYSILPLLAVGTYMIYPRHREANTSSSHYFTNFQKIKTSTLLRESKLIVKKQMRVSPIDQYRITTFILIGFNKRVIRQNR